MHRSRRSWRRLPNMQAAARSRKIIALQKMTETDISTVSTCSVRGSEDFSYQEECENDFCENQDHSSSFEILASSVLRYHPNHPYASSTGYFGNLDEFQTSSLKALKDQVAETPTEGELDISSITLNIDGNKHYENLDLCLLRYLRANDFNVMKSKSMIEENIAWRNQINISKMRQMESFEVLNVSSKDLSHIASSYYPHWLLGFGRCGQPILLYSYGKFNMKELTKYTTVKNLEMYHVWEQEKNAELLAKRTKEVGYIVESCDLVLDVKGLSLGQLSSDLLALLQFITETDGKYYPHRVGRTYIINTPPFFSMIWSVLKGIFEGSSSFVKIFSNTKEWQQMLRDEIGVDKLPLEYGGHGVSISEVPFLYQYHKEQETVDHRTSDPLESFPPEETLSESTGLKSMEDEAKPSIFSSPLQSLRALFDSYDLLPSDSDACVRLLFPELTYEHSKPTNHYPKPVREQSLAVRLLFGSE